MTREEVIVRFCALATNVGNHLDDLPAHDCFCGENSRRDWVNGFQFEEEIFTFIEDAVKAAMLATVHQ